MQPRKIFGVKVLCSMTRLYIYSKVSKMGNMPLYYYPSLEDMGRWTATFYETCVFRKKKNYPRTIG